MAQATGLYDARRIIEEAQTSIGLPPMDVFEDEDPYRPIGLADAYTLSVQSAEANQTKNSLPTEVMGVTVPISMDLLSCRLAYTADVVMVSSVSRGRGRPRKDGGDENQGLTYEMHIYDATLPPANALEQDLRISVLSQSMPTEIAGAAGMSVQSVMVRHMLTGEVHPVRPYRSSSVQILEGLARGVIAAERDGVYIPRMLLGWMACSSCSLRPRCFHESGVLNRLNPSLNRQIQLAQEMQLSLQQSLASAGVHDRKRCAHDADAILQWQIRHPECAPEQIQWALKSWSEQTV
jgi:hypothetical protein